MDIFSARLKWLRERKGLTQAEVAKAIGMSQSGYTKIEQGQREPKLDVLAYLPGIVGETVDFMLGVTDFTRNCQAIKDKYESASSNLTFIKYDLQEILLNPHSSDILTKDFDPDNPRSVKMKIEFLQKNIPLLENRTEIARTKLLNMLDEIPLVKKSTIQDILEGDPWRVLLNSDDDEEQL